LHKKIRKNYFFVAIKLIRVNYYGNSTEFTLNEKEIINIKKAKHN